MRGDLHFLKRPWDHVSIIRVCFVQHRFAFCIMCVSCPVQPADNVVCLLSLRTTSRRLDLQKLRFISILAEPQVKVNSEMNSASINLNSFPA